MGDGFMIETVISDLIMQLGLGKTKMIDDVRRIKTN